MSSIVAYRRGKDSTKGGSIRYSVDGAASTKQPADGGGSSSVSVYSFYGSSSVSGRYPADDIKGRYPSNGAIIKYPASVSSSNSGYPAATGKAGGFAVLPHPAPPPGADPRLWSCFLSVDADRSGNISVHELQAALVNGDSTPFDPETVKLLISLFDFNHTGEIDFEEFTKLSHYIEEWRRMFEHFDKDQSGTIDVLELRSVMTQFGTPLPSQLVSLLVAKFASSPSGSLAGEQTITFDRFIRTCVFARKFKESFADLDTDKDGRVQLNEQQCMKLYLMLP